MKMVDVLDNIPAAGLTENVKYFTFSSFYSVEHGAIYEGVVFPIT